MLDSSFIPCNRQAKYIIYIYAATSVAGCFASVAELHVAHIGRQRLQIGFACVRTRGNKLQEQARASKSELEQIRIVLVVTAAAAAHVSGLQSEDEGTICQSRLMCAAGYAQIQKLI